MQDFILFQKLTEAVIQIFFSIIGVENTSE